jgi:hypothetical protein
VDNTLGSLFVKELGIKMAYVKATEQSPLSLDAERSLSQPVAPKGPAPVVLNRIDTAVAKQIGGNDDENESTCSSAPKKQKNGNTCTILEPCMNFTDFCSNKDSAASEKKCRVNGKTTLIYNMCQ